MITEKYDEIIYWVARSHSSWILPNLPDREYLEKIVEYADGNRSHVENIIDEAGFKFIKSEPLRDKPYSAFDDVMAIFRGIPYILLETNPERTELRVEYYSKLTRYGYSTTTITVDGKEYRIEFSEYNKTVKVLGNANFEFKLVKDVTTKGSYIKLLFEKVKVSQPTVSWYYRQDDWW